MQADPCSDRRVLAVSGPDRVHFLQGLVTNDVRRLSEGPVYAALLTAQGKYLSDFLLVPDGERVLVDVAEAQADDLMRRLTLYKLRAKVTVEATALKVWRGLGAPPDGAVADPRDAGLGWRLYAETLDATPAGVDWDALRVRLGVPEAGRELIPDDSYILEMGFERLHGVDFRKGCYVGQEVTARMHHKTELRKGLRRVRLSGEAAPGTEILSGDKPAGWLGTVAGNAALAYLRFDRIGPDLRAGTAGIEIADT